MFDLQFVRRLIALALVWIGNGLADMLALPAAEPGSKAACPVLRIMPRQVIVPPVARCRPWGEQISIDLATRTRKFRPDGTNEVMSFTVLSCSELLHPDAFGGWLDFRVGEGAIVRLHENAAGEWT